MVERQYEMLKKERMKIHDETNKHNNNKTDESGGSNENSAASSPAVQENGQSQPEVSMIIN